MTGVVMADIVVNKDIIMMEMVVMAHLVELKYMNVYLSQVQ